MGRSLLLLMFGVVLCGCAQVHDHHENASRHARGHANLPSQAVGERATLPELNDGSDLSDYLTYAALNSADLESAFHQWKAALARVPQVTSLPDPRFTYRYFIEEIETRVGPQRQAFGLSQTFPWFGKLKLRGDMAGEQAEAARQRYEAKKLALFFSVADAYCEYYYLGRAVTTVGRNVELLRHLEEVVRTRYKTASAGHADLIRAQVELGKLIDRLAELRDLRGPLQSRLNAVLNRPMGTEIPFPKALPDEQLGVGDEQALAIFAGVNPELKALDHEVAERRRAIDLARKEYFPDVTLGVDYIDIGDPLTPGGGGLSSASAQRSLSRFAAGMGDAIDARILRDSFIGARGPNDAGKDAWIFSVSMNVPIWYAKYRAAEREAIERYYSVFDRRTDRRSALAAQVHMALFAWRDAERKRTLYGETLIPKATESLKTTESAFRTGEASFTDLIDAERVWLEFELLYERALADRVRRLVELDMLVGQRLPRKGDALDTRGRALSTQPSAE